MERLTIDKPVSEMNMIELAHNSCFAKNGEAYYRDFNGEISARDLARRLYKLFTSEELSKDNDTFDVEMMEELQYDIEIYPEGLVALYYRSLWAMADLRERLKKYEDAEEKGLMLQLPCKVGDTVYVPHRGKIQEMIIQNVSWNGAGFFFSWTLNSGIYPWLDGFIDMNIGKTVFLTQAEAEQKLKELAN